MDPKEHCITEPSSANAKAKCVRKQNLLVYDKHNPCVEKENLPKSCYAVTPLQKANPKKIRVCTGADLKRMCPPKLCACPAKGTRNTFLASVGRLLGFGVKSALAGGLIYWTYDIGLWGRSEETEQIYVDLCKFAFKPDRKEMDRLMHLAREQQGEFNKSCDVFARRNARLTKEIEESGVLITEDTIMARMKLCQKAPSIRENTNSFKNQWNGWVLATFDFIVNLPNRLCPKKQEQISEKKNKERDPNTNLQEKCRLKVKESREH